jgi:hypothetical protein
MLMANVADVVSFEQNVDPITDKSSYFLKVASKNDYLGLGCFEQGSKEVVVIVKFDDYVGDQQAGVFAGGMNVVYRFDKNIPIETRWSSEKDRGFSEYPLDFIKSMIGSSFFYIRGFDYSGSPVTADFSYTITAQMYQEMFQKCGLNADGTVPKKIKSKKTEKK